MSITYDVQFSLNLGNVFTGVEALMNGINGHLATMGYDERLSLRGRPIGMTVTVEREMTDQEIAKMKDAMTAQLCRSFPGSDPVCESFRRQSGNVPQSAS